MTSSPSLRGWSRLQACRGVLQTTTTTDDRHQWSLLVWPRYTTCRRASNKRLRPTLRTAHTPNAQSELITVLLLWEILLGTWIWGRVGGGRPVKCDCVIITQAHSDSTRCHIVSATSETSRRTRCTDIDWRTRHHALHDNASFTRSLARLHQRHLASRHATAFITATALVVWVWSLVCLSVCLCRTYCQKTRSGTKGVYKQYELWTSDKRPTQRYFKLTLVLYSVVFVCVYLCQDSQFSNEMTYT